MSLWLFLLALHPLHDFVKSRKLYVLRNCLISSQFDSQRSGLCFPWWEAGSARWSLSGIGIMTHNLWKYWTELIIPHGNGTRNLGDVPNSITNLLRSPHACITPEMIVFFCCRDSVFCVLVTFLISVSKHFSGTAEYVSVVHFLLFFMKTVL